jgi:GNAT superfamily N-acetyltransferase
MITVIQAGSEQMSAVLQLVESLLAELADDPAEFAGWDATQVEPILRESGDRFAAFLAVAPGGNPIGVATLTEAVAAYAQGKYGIISELYVARDYRGRGVGKLLLDTVAAFGRRRGWRRMDVTAPPEARWGRVVEFYRQNGFVYTGPKLRLDLLAGR